MIDKNMTTESKASAKKSTASAKTSASPVIYIGPDIKGVTRENTVFNNGIPKSLTDLAEKITEIKGLIIPVSSLASANAKLKNKNSALSILYSKVQGQV